NGAIVVVSAGPFGLVMWVVAGWQRADALEFLGAYFDLGQALGGVEMGRGAVCHGRDLQR
ncbi:hypothetical protein VW29_00015, partial [Devosia limi DSM 17137]